MARISGINIPLNKRVEIGLTYIYGIGRSSSNELLAQVGIEPDRKVRDLTEEEVVKLRDLIDSSLMVEGDLRRERTRRPTRARARAPSAYRWPARRRPVRSNARTSSPPAWPPSRP